MKTVIFVALKKENGEYDTQSLINLEKITGIFGGKTETGGDMRFDKNGLDYIRIYQDDTEFHRVSCETAMEFIERVQSKWVLASDSRSKEHGVYMLAFHILDRDD